jgi:hypothetical protein
MFDDDDDDVKSDDTNNSTQLSIKYIEKLSKIIQD